MTKLTAYVLIRKTFDSRVQPITLFFDGNDFQPDYDKAYRYSYRALAQEKLKHIEPKQANEFIMTIETTEVNCL